VRTLASGVTLAIRGSQYSALYVEAVMIFQVFPRQLIFCTNAAELRREKF
jgi:hypothetical protein